MTMKLKILKIIIIVINLLKQHENAVSDNVGEANIISAITTSYKNTIRYFDLKSLKMEIIFILLSVESKNKKTKRHTTSQYETIT